MDKFKQFIKKKKLDSKFKKLGGGYQLGEHDDGPGGVAHSGESLKQHVGDGDRRQQQKAQRSNVDLIATAAEKRFQQMEGKEDAHLTPMQKIVKMQAKKELEEERRKMEQQMEMLDTRGPLPKTTEKSTPNVLYTCEIFDDNIALPKSEMMDAIKSMLYEHMPADPVGASIWLIYTFNRDDQQRTTAIETIRKYLQNIIDHPEEKKYLQINMSNKIFMERVEPVIGSLEFLHSVGFQKEQRTTENHKMDIYLVMSSPDIQQIADALKSLLKGKAIIIRVFRDPKVFIIDPGKPLPNPQIPDDFFRRTPDEIRQEQRQKADALEQMTALRTQRTRELDSKRKEIGNYKYCYIRIRFPNNYLLQGIFNVYEKFVAIREFVHHHLSFKHGVFMLSLAGAANNRIQHINEADNSLLECGLVPSALIHFAWDSDAMAYFSQKGHDISYLQPEMEENALRLN